MGWRLATFIALAVSVGLLLALASTTISRNDARRARDDAIMQVSTLKAGLTTCRANVATLERALSDHGAATKRVADQAAAEREEGARRLQAVAQRNADLLASVQTLRGLLSRSNRPVSCEEGWDAFRAAVDR